MTAGLGYRIWLNSVIYLLVLSIHPSLIEERYSCDLPGIMKLLTFMKAHNNNNVASFRDYDTNKINYMYAQYVKNTMEPLNIPDVCKDRRFPWTVSKISLGLKFRNEKCFSVWLLNLFFAFPLFLSRWSQLKWCKHTVRVGRLSEAPSLFPFPSGLTKINVIDASSLLQWRWSNFTFLWELFA